MPAPVRSAVGSWPDHFGVSVLGSGPGPLAGAAGGRGGEMRGTQSSPPSCCSAGGSPHRGRAAGDAPPVPWPFLLSPTNPETRREPFTGVGGGGQAEPRSCLLAPDSGFVVQVLSGCRSAAPGGSSDEPWREGLGSSDEDLGRASGTPPTSEAHGSPKTRRLPGVCPQPSRGARLALGTGTRASARQGARPPAGPDLASQTASGPLSR